MVLGGVRKDYMKTLTLEEIHKIRHTSGSYEKIEAAANKLLSEGIVEGTNDYAMAQYALISDYYWQVGKTEEGQIYLKKAQNYIEYATDKIALISVFILSGNYACVVDNYAGAATYFFRALELCEDIEYEAELGRIYNNIASLFNTSHGFEESYKYYKLAERYSRRQVDSRSLPILYNNLSELCIFAERYEEAKTYIDIAATYVDAYGTPIRRLNHEIMKWRYALYKNDRETCFECYNMVQKYLKDIPYGNNYIVGTLALFDNLVSMGEAPLAVKWLEEDIQHLELASDYKNLKKYYAHLKDYYKHTENIDLQRLYADKFFEVDQKNEEKRLNNRLKTLSNLNQTYLQNKKNRDAMSSQMSLLTDKNTQLSVANSNLRLVNEIGVGILSTTDLEHIYDILSSRINELFQVDEFGIALVDEERRYLNLSYSKNQGKGPLRLMEIPLTSKASFSVQAFSKNKEIIINDLEKEYPDLYEVINRDGEVFLSLMYLPIVVDDWPIGVMTVQLRQRNVFTETHLEVSKLLATFASVSFKNAQHNLKLTDEIEKRSEVQFTLEEINSQLDYLARHDDLTGLYNRRTFMALYHEAFHISQSLGQSMTLMILDIDFFKQYNDHYGHIAGDDCIKKVAKTLKEPLRRSTDIVARYGGDEFMVLLPETDRLGAEYVAGKIVDAIRNLQIPHYLSTVSDYVTISVGLVSMVLTDGHDAEQLLIDADKALYKAKKEYKRNTYCLD